MDLDDIPFVSGDDRFGHLGALRHDRFGLFRRINDECGDIGRLRVLNRSLVVVNSPELIHDVLVEKAKSFEKSPALRGALRPLVGEGLFTSEGELWRRQRKLMAPLFTQAQVARYADTMIDCARDAVSSLRAGTTVDMARVTTHIAMRVAGKALLGIETQAEADALGEALTTALHWADAQTLSSVYSMQLMTVWLIAKVAERLPRFAAARARALVDPLIEPIRWPGKTNTKISRALDTIEQLVVNMIAERRKSQSPQQDLLQLLLDARDEEGSRMSDKQLRDEIVTLFIAGHETTATALSWALYLLARHPDAYQRAKEEALAIGTRELEGRDLAALGYCSRVFKESMRLYPPIYFFGRQAIEDVRIGDYDLSRDMVVLINPYTLHRRAKIWPDPERFDPSRFERAAEEARHRQAYLPFSAGPRTCIGNFFALMEGPLVLATILRHVDVELVNPIVEPEPSATLRPRGGMPMRIIATTGRKSAALPVSAAHPA
jgi:cytochrome P450